jgi:hypothetical protein
VELRATVQLYHERCAIADHRRYAEDMRVAPPPWPATLIAGIFLGGLAVGLICFVQAQPLNRTGIVDAGPVADFEAAGQFRPVLYASHAFYLVKTDTGEPRALYAYAPFTQVQENRGCPVEWHDHIPGTEWAEVFRDRCVGSTFRRDGTYLFGPSTRNLDQFRIEIRDGRILVDTRRLLCDGPGPCRQLR